MGDVDDTNEPETGCCVVMQEYFMHESCLSLKQASLGETVTQAGRSPS